MSTISFVKYQGAGNDFILIDDRAHFFCPSKVVFLCDRKFGIGADGVILLQNAQNADFRMRIYNSDGTEAQSCGNGLRCLLKFILYLGFLEKNYTIATKDRIVIGSYVGDKVKVEMGGASDVKQLYIEGLEIYSLNTGVPHAVCFVPHLERIDFLAQASRIRHHSVFQKSGTNVNFGSFQTDGTIKVRTFERGVEGETLSCGTGAAAVGYVAHTFIHQTSPILLDFPGGKLEIEVTGGQISMTGPAQIIFSGSINY